MGVGGSQQFVGNPIDWNPVVGRASDTLGNIGKQQRRKSGLW